MQWNSNIFFFFYALSNDVWGYFKQWLQSKNAEQIYLEGHHGGTPSSPIAPGQTWGWSYGMSLPGRWPETPRILEYWTETVKNRAESHQGHSYALMWDPVENKSCHLPFINSIFYLSVFLYYSFKVAASRVISSYFLFQTPQSNPCWSHSPGGVWEREDIYRGEGGRGNPWLGTFCKPLIAPLPHPCWALGTYANRGNDVLALKVWC